MHRVTGDLRRGFTLIEVLIVIAIIAIIAAVLIPNLLAPRGLAHDAGTITCLKELGTRQEAVASDEPFTYDPAFDPTTLTACDRVNFTVVNVTDTMYEYQAIHDLGEYEYRVSVGTPVRRVP